MHITDYREHIGSSAATFFKSTLFQSSPGQLGHCRSYERR
jgi:hypothetical protein